MKACVIYRGMGLLQERLRPCVQPFPCVFRHRLAFAILESNRWGPYWIQEFKGSWHLSCCSSTLRETQQEPTLSPTQHVQQQQQGLVFISYTQRNCKVFLVENKRTPTETRPPSVCVCARCWWSGRGALICCVVSAPWKGDFARTEGLPCQPTAPPTGGHSEVNTAHTLSVFPGIRTESRRLTRSWCAWV